MQVVEMVAGDVPDLTIIDLPGIVRTPVAGQVQPCDCLRVNRRTL